MPLQRAAKKYGNENFVFNVMFECSSEEEARITEQLLLDYYASNKIRWALLYNTSKKAGGGDLGEEANKKHSETLLQPKHRRRLSDTLKKTVAR